MTSTLVDTKPFYTVDELIEALSLLAGYDTVLVHDRDGRQLTTAVLYEVTLTDKSKVYNVYLT